MYGTIDIVLDVIRSGKSICLLGRPGVGKTTMLRECARVLRAGGYLVLVDQFSPLLIPTIATSRRGKARTPRRADRLLARAGFDQPRWHRVQAIIINAAVAAKAS